jgi:hypothetical protein
MTESILSTSPSTSLSLLRSERGSTSNAAPSVVVMPLSVRATGASFTAVTLI